MIKLKIDYVLLWFLFKNCLRINVAEKKKENTTRIVAGTLLNQTVRNEFILREITLLSCSSVSFFILYPRVRKVICWVEYNAFNNSLEQNVS